MSGDPDRYILYLLALLSASMVQQPEYVNELSSNYRQSLRVSNPQGFNLQLHLHSHSVHGGGCSLTALCYLQLSNIAQVMHMHAGHGGGRSLAVLLAGGEGWRAYQNQARATVLRHVSSHQRTAVKVC